MDGYDTTTITITPSPNMIEVLNYIQSRYEDTNDCTISHHDIVEQLIAIGLEKLKADKENRIIMPKMII